MSCIKISNDISQFWMYNKKCSAVMSPSWTIFNVIFKIMLIYSILVQVILTLIFPVFFLVDCTQVGIHMQRVSFENKLSIKIWIFSIIDWRVPDMFNFALYFLCSLSLYSAIQCCVPLVYSIMGNVWLFAVWPTAWDSEVIGLSRSNHM